MSVHFKPTEKVYDPVVETMEPAFGPQAGGTNITLTGQHFIHPVETVNFDNSNYVCPVTSSYVINTVILQPGRPNPAHEK